MFWLLLSVWFKFVKNWKSLNTLHVFLRFIALDRTLKLFKSSFCSQLLLVNVILSHYEVKSLASFLLAIGVFTADNYGFSGASSIFLGNWYRMDIFAFKLVNLFLNLLIFTWVNETPITNFKIWVKIEYLTPLVLIYI